ncbi:hypothetical protein LTS08_004573 [Lithohypha guttulata]|nr:hypothetical protein LTS08_004573 [Lithohypha guttulata]
MRYSTASLASVWLVTHAFAAPIDPCAPPAGIDVPMLRDPIFGYLGNVTLGTPAQQLTMFYDWTWTSPYFLSATCSNNTAEPDECFAASQQLFHQDNSNSFVNMTSEYPDQVWYPNEFLPAPFEVAYGTDAMTMGSGSSAVTIQLSDIQMGLLVQMPLQFGGIMGLMPTFPDTKASQQSAFYQQWQSGMFESPFSAFVTCRNGQVKNCPAGADAIQTFGGYSAELASKGLTWYPLTSVPTVNQIAFPLYPEIFSYWAIELESFSIGTEQQAVNTTAEQQLQAKPAAIFDHASKGRGLPLSSDAYARLVEITGAVPATDLAMPPNNAMQPFFTVNCSTISKLPTVSYVFTGSAKEWLVKPEAYVANMGGTCVLDVRVLGSGSWELGNFGDNFLQDKYIVFDYEKNMVGLAEL